METLAKPFASKVPAQFKSHNGAPGSFASVVGEFDHAVVLNGGEPHARFDVNVNGSPYEADINVESTHGGNSDVQYAVKDQVVSSMPADGVHQGDRFSYADQGLTQSDFKTVDDNTLRTQLEQMAKNSSRIELLGETYHDGPGQNGIHDIHMNKPGQDGAVRFYTNEGGQIHQDTVYIKFQNQNLPGSRSLGVG